MVKNMKILWFTNGMLPIVAADIGIKAGVNEGWLVGLSEQIIKAGEHELCVCFPQTISSKLIQGKVNKIEYFGYPLCKSKELYDENLKSILCGVIKSAKPNVIHLMGSEYPHCYSMVSACEKCGVLEKVVVSIQGLISVYAGHTTTGISEDALKTISLKDVLRKTSLSDFTKHYSKRGEYEVKALSKVHNVIGRTTWDYACTGQINPNRKYYFNNETLRPSFYFDKWSVDYCEQHSIFFSQATTSIKGFHYLLQALPEIVKKNPDTKVYVAAYEKYDRYKNTPKWLRPQYANYICSLIDKYKLEKHIVYCGSLNEAEMKKRFLKSNVFVSSSTIENSPNSVGEAMLLGVPVVSSDVGGVRDLIRTNEEGFVYSVDAPYMLAHYINEIFADPEMAMRMSKREIERAEYLHNPEKNYQQLIEIYKKIAIQ